MGAESFHIGQYFRHVVGGRVVLVFHCGVLSGRVDVIGRTTRTKRPWETFAESADKTKR